MRKGALGTSRLVTSKRPIREREAKNSRNGSKQGCPAANSAPSIRRVTTTAKALCPREKTLVTRDFTRFIRKIPPVWNRRERTSRDGFRGLMNGAVDAPPVRNRSRLVTTFHSRSRLPFSPCYTRVFGPSRPAAVSCLEIALFDPSKLFSPHGDTTRHVAVTRSCPSFLP